MNKETRRKALLGIFTILGLIMFTILVYFIGDKQDLFSETFRIKAVFANVNGLGTGNNVRFAGIDIGTVKEVTIITDTTVLVEMEIKEDTRRFIKNSAIATVGTDGLMGNKLVVIKNGPKVKNARPITAMDTLSTQAEVDITAMMETFSHTNENLRVITEQVIGVLDSIKEEKGPLGALISDESLTISLKETINSFKATGDQFTILSKDLSSIVKKVDEGEGTIGSLLSDTTMAGRINKMVAGFEQTSSNTETLTRDLNTLINKVSSGQGAAGSLLTDKSMTDDLGKTMGNLKESSLKINELLEAAKHNFLFKGYFKKQEKAALKAAEEEAKK